VTLWLDDPPCEETATTAGFHPIRRSSTHRIFEGFKAAHWAFGNTPTGETKRRRFLRIKMQYEEFLAGRGPELAQQGPSEVSADPEDALEFALEAHLRDFLALSEAGDIGEAIFRRKRSTTS